ncbi:DEAD/DEAH box helicase family protein [Streptomyces sp. NPDC058256]|uniref:DEAD/DEAH box helicase n=1 Tax=Streptomyces sp. NPDC058256 TaxID=3346408 RepID=UPI0036ECC671
MIVGPVGSASPLPVSVDLEALFDHQPEAIEAVMRAYTRKPNSRRKHFRTQVHMAPGLGKTRVAFAVGERVAAPGSMLFAVPTRALLEQTYEVLRAVGRSGPVIAVYDDRGSALLGLEDVWVTTSARQLARLVQQFLAQGVRQYTVLATYSSVETIIAAHALTEQQDKAVPLPEWDLLVADEAHHTETSRQWGRINSQRLVPACHRLAMTATSRLMGMVGRDKKGQLKSDPAVRMSEKIHGPVAYALGLSEAQRRGKLAHSEVVAAEVDEERLREMVRERGRADEEVQAELLAASLGAVLRAAGRAGCRRLLAYHRTVAGAKAAAEALPEQAWLLHAQGTGAPRRVFATALWQDTSGADRKKALAALAAGTDLKGRPVDLVVVHSVRVLTEGIDVPRVDAAALVDPRGAQHELLQIAGRAVRFDLENPAKTASVIVPVLHLNQPADDTMDGEAWDPVINMLRAVESYEPDGGSASTETTSRSPHSVLTSEEEKARQDARAKEIARMLRLTRARSMRVVADRLKVTVVSDPASADIERVMQAAIAYHAREDHLKVPADHLEGDVRLGLELDKLRRKRREDLADLARLVEELGEAAGEKEWRRRGPRVHPDLVHYLTRQLGFVWEPRESGRALLLQAARIYVDVHGHLLPRADEHVDVDGQDVAIGELLADRRHRAQDPYLQRRLDAIGVWQVPGDVPWTAAWHRQLERLALFKAEGGRRAELLHGRRVFRGGDLGAWLQKQHLRWKELHEQQRRVLAGLRMGPAHTDKRVGQAGVAPRRDRAERLMEIVIAAQRHLAEVGPLVGEDGRHRVHDTYRPVIGGREVQLRQRLNAVRNRYPTYPPDLRALFTGLGLPWATPEPDRIEPTGET